jgi:hypothetical protein
VFTEPVVSIIEFASITIESFQPQLVIEQVQIENPYLKKIQHVSISSPSTKTLKHINILLKQVAQNATT